MTTDKLFILMLVILLPLTGCLDIADTAEAEDSDEENTTTTMPMVHSLHIEAGANATLDFDGTTTMKLETIYHNGYGSQAPSVTGQAYNFDMTCNGTLMINDGHLVSKEYLPVLGGQLCTVVITATSEYFLVFSEASLSAL